MPRQKRIVKKKKKEETMGLSIVGTDAVVSVDAIKPNTFNYNKQSSFIFDKMIKSLTKFGFVDPIEVRSGNENGKFDFYEVIGGEHRLRAAEELGFKEIPIRDLGIVSDTVAKELCIVLNETKGKPDPDALAALIDDLNSAVGRDEIVDILPFDSAEIDSYLSMGNEGDWLEDVSEDALLDEGAYVTKPSKNTLINAMGLLDISKNKEDFLLERYNKLIKELKFTNSPIKVLETLITKALDELIND